MNNANKYWNGVKEMPDVQRTVIWTVLSDPITVKDTSLSFD